MIDVPMKLFDYLSHFRLHIRAPVKKLSGANKRPTLLKMEAEKLYSVCPLPREKVMISDGQAPICALGRQYAAAVVVSLSHV